MLQRIIKYSKYNGDLSKGEEIGNSLEDLRNHFKKDGYKFYHKDIIYDKDIKENETIGDLQFKFSHISKETKLNIYVVIARLLNTDNIEVLGYVDGIFEGANYIQEDLINNFALEREDIENLIYGAIDNMNINSSLKLQNLLKTKGLVTSYNRRTKEYSWNRNKRRIMNNEELLELYKEIKEL